MLVSPVADLGLVMVALHLIECAHWVRRDQWWLHRRPFGRYAVSDCSSAIGNELGGLKIADPALTLGPAFRVEQPFLSADAEYCLPWLAISPSKTRSASSPPPPTRWAEIGNIEVEEDRVLIDGVLFHRSSSAQAAEHHARALAKLVDATPQERLATLRAQMTEALDSEAIQQSLRTLDDDSRALRELLRVQWVLLFLITPTLIWILGFATTWLPILIGIQASGLLLTAFWWQTDRRRRPAAKWNRWSRALIHILCPPIILRSCDAWGDETFVGRHPLAVAKELLPPSDWRQMAAWCLRDLNYPVTPEVPGGDAGADSLAASSRLLWRQAIEKWLRSHGEDPATLNAHPAPQEHGAVARCPRCLESFTQSHATCATCQLQAQPIEN